MALSIRELQPDDLAATLGLCKDFFAEYEQHHEAFFDTDDLTDTDISERFVQSMTSDRSATFVALDDGVIVGYATVAIREQPRFYQVKEVGTISGLMVAEAHRRRGIATLLLTEARAFFRRHGIRYYTLYTAVANRGTMEFYERNGMSALHTTLIGDAREQQDDPPNPKA